MNIPTLIIFGWLALTLIVGLAARKRGPLSIEEWFVGARGFGITLLWFILAAEWLSAFAFLGGPGWAFSKGAPAFYIIVYCGMYPIFFYLLMPRTQELGRKYNYVTQIDLIVDRYRNKIIPIIMVLVSYVSLIPYVGLQMMGTGYIFKVATGGIITFHAGVLIAFGIVCLYVYTSGVRGVGWTTFMQGVFMFICAISAAIYIGRSQFGSIHQMFLAIEESHPEALVLPGRGEPMSINMFGTSVLLCVFGGAMWPHIFQRFYTARSVKTAKLTSALTPFVAILNIAVTIIGLSGILLISKGIKPDTVLIEVLKTYTPLWFLGLLCAGALAAAMSTGAGLVHTLASITGRDVYYRYINHKASSTRITVVTRIAVLAITGLAYVFALISPASLVYILLMAYGGVSQFLPGVIGAIFWSRANKKGVLAGLITGLVVTGIFTFSTGILKHPFGIHAGFWGLCINILVFVLVSLATKPDPPEVVSRFFEEA